MTALKLLNANARLQGKLVGIIPGANISIHTPTPESKLCYAIVNTALLLNVYLGERWNYLGGLMDWDWSVELEELDKALKFEELLARLETIEANIAHARRTGSKVGVPENWHKVKTSYLAEYMEQEVKALLY